MHCGGFYSGMGATNLNSKGPTDFRSRLGIYHRYLVFRLYAILSDVKPKIKKKKVTLDIGLECDLFL